MHSEFKITDHLLENVRLVNSPNQDARPAGDEISLLVIHNISLPPGEFGGCHIDELFCNSLDPEADPFFNEIAQLRVSAHLLIDRTGLVTQYVPFDRRAWHAGLSSFEGREACNDFAIGIELEGTDSVDFTDPQYLVLAGITEVLMLAYPGITPQRVVGHCDISPDRKTDPGPCFDWKRFRAGLVVSDSETGP